MDENNTVSKADLARLVGVRRSTVTNWQRRYRDFPEPVAGTDSELFRVGELAGWLAHRRVPADERRTDEAPEITYADRLRRSLRIAPVRAPATAVSEQAARVADRLRSTRIPLDADLLHVVLTMLYLRTGYPDQWGYLRAASTADASGTRLLAAWRHACDTLATEHSSPGLPRVDDARLREHWHQLATAIQVLDDLSGGEVAAAVFDLLVDQDDLLVPSARGITTPVSVTRLVSELASGVCPEPRIYDPFCRTGELLAAVVDRHIDDPVTARLTVAGRHPDPRAAWLARMRLGIRGVPAVLGGPVPEPGTCDIVVTNPPFNSAEPVDVVDPRWIFGPPPRQNANFAWLQYVIPLLRENGQAAVVMANNASSSTHSRERQIRRSMVEHGAVDSVIVLPSQMFARTGVPVTLWLLRPPAGSGTDVLFIDARALGSMSTRTRRTLSAEDIATIADQYRAWRAGSRATVTGLCQVASVAQIRERDYALSPPMYVPAPVPPRPDLASVQRAHARLREAQVRADEIDMKVEQMIRRVTHGSTGRPGA